MITIPNRQTKIVKQINRSKILGDLWASFNIDLQSSLGLIKVSPRLQINTQGVANQGLSVVFKTFEGLVFTIAGTRVFRSASANLISAFTEDASSGAITTYDPTLSDMEIFGSTTGILMTTGATKLMSKALSGGTGAWTQRGTALTTGLVHKLCYFVKFNRMYYIDNNTQIKSIDTAWAEAVSGNYFIDLATFRLGVPYTMASDSTDIWIGTVKISDLNNTDFSEGASILRWDGISSQITSEYKIRARGVLTLCKDDKGTMHAIDSNGALLAFNGSGFNEIDRLPLDRVLLTNALTGVYNSFIHPNGFTLSRNGTFLVNINNVIGDSGSTVKENLGSGIWEWSKDTGFVHKHSYSYNTVGSTTVTDHGQNRVSAVGALSEMNLYSTSATGKPTLIAGATYYTDASSTSSGIFVDDPLNTVQKYGYIVSAWIQSQNLKDNWQKIAAKYRKFLDATDKIIFKYRTIETTATEISITWASTTTFSTATNVSAMIGNEVEVIQGTGSGKCSHIVSVSGAGPYTVTVDEVYTGVTTGTAKARVQTWIKTAVVNDQMTESFIKAIVNMPSSERIQLKVCMQFTGDNELHEVVLINAPHTQLI